MSVDTPQKNKPHRKDASKTDYGKPLPALSSEEIMAVIPHRPPFLMIDRVTQHTCGETIEGYKNLAMNEPFFAGHFPGNPIFPGVLQLEAMAQLGGVLLQHMEEGKGKLGLFTGIDKVRFRRVVKPGDRFDMCCELLRLRLPIGKSLCKGYVDGELAVEAELMFSLIDPKLESELASK